MWKKIKDNWQKYLLALLAMLFGADQAQEAGVFGAGAEAEAEPYTVVVSFATPDGGGAFPAFQDDAGPVELSVAKPTDARVAAKFRDAYGELYPAARVTGFVVTRRPDKGEEPVQDEPDEK